MVIDYTLGGIESERISEADLAATKYNTLEWSYFLGDIRISSDSRKMEFINYELPILYCAASFLDIALSLCDEGQEVFDFPESGDWIKFSSKDLAVEISASVAATKINCQRTEFKAAAAEFFSRTHSDFTKQWPQLSSNPGFQYRQAALREKLSRLERKKN